MVNMSDKRELILDSISSDFVVNLKNREHYGTFLGVLYEGQLFGLKKSGSVHEICSQVNSALNSNKNRLEGLCLLQQLLLQCSSTVFVQHALSWLRMLTQTLQSHDPAVNQRLACHVTGEVLRFTNGVSELKREVSNSHIPAIVQALIEAKPEWQVASLKCICDCIRFYNGPCGPYKARLEKLVIGILDAHDQDIIEAAAGVYALLPSAGGGGSLGVKHTEAWTISCNRLIGTLHATIGHLYQDIEIENTEYDRVRETLQLNEPSLGQPSRTMTLQTRYCTLVTCLCHMLSGNLPAPAKVPVTDILGVICRTLAITQKQLMKKPTQEKTLLCSVLPLLHRDALQILNTLILSCRSHLVMASGTINRLFVQVLNWSLVDVQTYGDAKPFGGLRSSVYKALLQWLTLVGEASGIEISASDLLPHLLADTKPAANTLKLKQTTVREQSGGAKKKSKHGHQDAETGTLHNKINVDANADVCQYALQVLRMLLLQTGCFLKPQHHQQIQEMILHTLLDVHASPQSPPIPYANPQCRLGLYQVLHSCVLSPHPQYPSPTQMAVPLFAVGRRDADPQIASFCVEASVACESIMHPRAPSLCFPLLTAAYTPPSQATPPETTSVASPLESTEPLLPRVVVHVCPEKYPAQSQEYAWKRQLIQKYRKQYGEDVEINFEEVSEEEEEYADESKMENTASEEQKGNGEDEDHNEESNEEEEDDEVVEIEVLPKEAAVSLSGMNQEAEKRLHGYLKSYLDLVGETSTTDSELRNKEIRDVTIDAVKPSCSKDSENQTLKDTPNGVESVPPQSDTITATTEQISLSTSTKRKLEESDNDGSSEVPSAKKQEVDTENEETELMLASFVDASPDSD